MSIRREGYLVTTEVLNQEQLLVKLGQEAKVKLRVDIIGKQKGVTLRPFASATDSIIETRIIQKNENNTINSLYDSKYEFEVTILPRGRTGIITISIEVLEDKIPTSSKIQIPIRIYSYKDSQDTINAFLDLAYFQQEELTFDWACVYAFYFIGHFLLGKSFNMTRNSGTGISAAEFVKNFTFYGLSLLLRKIIEKCECDANKVPKRKHLEAFLLALSRLVEFLKKPLVVDLWILGKILIMEESKLENMLMKYRDGYFSIKISITSFLGMSDNNNNIEDKRTFGPFAILYMKNGELQKAGISLLELEYRNLADIILNNNILIHCVIEDGSFSHKSDLLKETMLSRHNSYPPHKTKEISFNSKQNVELNGHSNKSVDNNGFNMDITSTGAVLTSFLENVPFVSSMIPLPPAATVVSSIPIEEMLNRGGWPNYVSDFKKEAITVETLSKVEEGITKFLSEHMHIKHEDAVKIEAFFKNTYYS